MNVVDVLVGVTVALAGLRAFFRGFVAQALVLVSILAGLVTAYWCSELLRQWWGRGGEHSLLALRILISAIAALVVFGIFQLAAERAGQAANESLLGPVNRVAGLAVGIVTGLAASSLVLLLLVSTPLPKPVRSAVHASWSAPRLFQAGERVARLGEPLIPGSGRLARSFRRAREEKILEKAREAESPGE